MCVCAMCCDLFLFVFFSLPTGGSVIYFFKFLHHAAMAALPAPAVVVTCWLQPLRNVTQTKVSIQSSTRCFQNSNPYAFIHCLTATGCFVFFRLVSSDTFPFAPPIVFSSFGKRNTTTTNNLAIYVYRQIMWRLVAFSFLSLTIGSNTYSSTSVGKRRKSFSQ